MYGDLEIEAPRDPYREFSDNVKTLGDNLEKSSAPNLKTRFGEASLPQQSIAGLGLKNILQPKEPIQLPEQQQAAKIDPREINIQAQCGGAFLQDCKLGAKADSFFSVACTEVSNDIRGIAASLKGPQPAIDYANDPLLQQRLALNDLAPRPPMGGLL